jgi:hypothetical protein
MAYAVPIRPSVAQPYKHLFYYSDIYMYKGWAIKSSPCTATFNDLLCFILSLRVYY